MARRLAFLVICISIVLAQISIQNVNSEQSEEKEKFEIVLQQAKIKLAETTSKGVAAIAKGWEWFGFKAGFGEQCKFVENPSASIRKHLKTHLRAQDHALETIVGAIESWEFSRRNSKEHSPLVIAITGPTGTGKTETSNLIAEALFKHRKRLQNSDKEVPTGLLVFRGEDFSDNYTNPLSQYQEQIKSRLVAHLNHCSGKAIVVVDEVQKVIPNTLDVLATAMTKNAQLTYYNNGVARKIDCSNVIFVLISDIGVTNMERVLMQYEKRDDVPQAALENEVKKALDAQWKRLQMGKLIHQVVPFLPFEQHHVVEIIELKLTQLSQNYAGQYWNCLEFATNIAPHLSLLESVAYIERRAMIQGKEVRKVFAKYGARGVESGPIQELKSKLLRYLRPWNANANITVSLVGDEIEIISCYEETQTNSDFIQVACVSKWKGSFI